MALDLAYALDLLPVLDDFDRTNGENPPSANWSGDVRGAGNGTLTISSNVAVGTTASTNDAWYSLKQFPVDQAVAITIETNIGTLYMYARLQAPGTTGVDGYYASITPTLFRIYSMTNAVTSLISSSIAITRTAGDRYALTLVGDQITAWQDKGSGWVALETITHSTYELAGYVAVGTSNTSLQLNDFRAGAIPSFFNEVTFDDFEFLPPDYVIVNFEPDTHANRLMRAGVSHMSGSLNLYGTGRGAIKSVWNPKLSLQIKALTRGSLYAKLESIHQLYYRGVKPLIWTIPGKPDRTVYARLKEIKYDFDVSGDTTEFIFPLDMEFEVTEGGWLETSIEKDYTAWADSTRFEDGTRELSVVGDTSGTITVTVPYGITFVYPRISIQGQINGDNGYFRIERLIGATTVDQIDLKNTIFLSLTSQRYEIDCRLRTVYKDGSGAYSHFTYATPHWFRLEPGDNTIKLTNFSTAAGGGNKVKFWWYGRYR